MANKHKTLTLDEIEQYRLSHYLTRLLDEIATEFNIEKSKIRVLDFGCGRGLLTAKFLALGYEAYGVDIEEYVLSKGRDALKQLHADPDKHLIKITPGNDTPFPDNFFHLIITRDVLEHVENLDTMLKEYHRIMIPQGKSFHSFIAKWNPREPHLGLRFIHWLPKNWLRYWYLWLSYNKLPYWIEFENLSKKERIAFVYNYSINQTFYRSISEIESSCKKNKLQARFYTNTSPSRLLKLLFPFFYFFPKPTKRFWTWKENTFNTVILYISKPGTL
ncbi:MAG: class I SAM-dependent methyltransferase [Chitinophagales bacterium]|nr:class I SAM-dependent methyltransferase [Chitinophagales bacterium]